MQAGAPSLNPKGAQRTARDFGRAVKIWAEKTGTDLDQVVWRVVMSLLYNVEIHGCVKSAEVLLNRLCGAHAVAPMVHIDARAEGATAAPTDQLEAMASVDFSDHLRTVADIHDKITQDNPTSRLTVKVVSEETGDGSELLD